MSIAIFQRVLETAGALEDESVLYVLSVIAAIDIRNAKRVRLITFSSGVCLPLLNFSPLFHKRYHFRKKKKNL